MNSNSKILVCVYIDSHNRLTSILTYIEKHSTDFIYYQIYILFTYFVNTAFSKKNIYLHVICRL